jgi:uncharacterized protein YmfQ (DUF2313 family)
MGYANLQPADFEEAVARKLPPRGKAWTRLLGSIFQGFWRVIADALAAVHARSADLTELEAFPPTSVELLSQWETVLGLPDPCLPTPSSTAARQAAVALRLTATGGQSVSYFETVAAQLGASISITEFAPFRWGINKWTQPLLTASYANTWEVTLLGSSQFFFLWGVSSWGEPYWQPGLPAVQCELLRLAPAHTKVLFQGTF